MTVSKKNSVSNSKKSNVGGKHFEPLESRQMMSASLTHPAMPPVVHVKEETHALVTNEAKSPSLSIVTTPIKTIITTPVKTLPIPIKIPIHLPTLFIEPKVDSNVTGWINVSKDPLFAPGGPSANDVTQGNVGDCWFVASLAEVALRDPSLIEKDITQLSDGTYDVTFHTSPTATIVEHVDGELPVNGGGGLEYAQLGTDNSTWVAIMEKALTYFRNRSIPASYNTINNGWGSEALADLGGSTTEVLSKVSNGSQLFNDVVLSLILNLGVDFGTKGSGGGPLVNSHEYSVVSVEVKSGVDYIEVRNPWGYNPNFVANKNGYGATNNGYMWVSANSVYPELDEFVTASL